MKNIEDLLTNTLKCWDLLQIQEYLILKPKFMDYVFVQYAYNSNGDQFLVHNSSIEDMHYNTIME